MSNLEVLVATMHQNDFSLIKSMNVHSDIVIANQAEITTYEEIEFDGNCGKMITTNLRGVGLNRNLALMYSTADICILADDDVTYYDDYVERVLSEFEKFPSADIIIFNFELISDNEVRTPKKTNKTHKMHRWSKNGYTTYRIAFKRNAFLKNHLFFSTLFGGGCKYPCGEDTMWIENARAANLNIYLSEVCIGKVDQSDSSWFSNIEPEAYFYGRGAYLKNVFPKTYPIWILLYYSWRGSLVKAPAIKRVRWMFEGVKGFESLRGWNER